LKFSAYDGVVERLFFPASPPEDSKLQAATCREVGVPLAPASFIFTRRFPGLMARSREKIIV
jgi:hypothetical protein